MVKDAFYFRPLNDQFTLLFHSNDIPKTKFGMKVCSGTI